MKEGNDFGDRFEQRRPSLCSVLVGTDGLSCERSDADITDTGVSSGLVQSGRGEAAVLESTPRCWPARRRRCGSTRINRTLEISKTSWRHISAMRCQLPKRLLRLCRQLRNKVLHSDFYAARGKLGELGIDTQSGGVKMIPLPVATVEEFAKKIAGARAGTEGTNSPTRCHG